MRLCLPRIGEEQEGEEYSKEELRAQGHRIIYEGK